MCDPSGRNGEATVETNGVIETILTALGVAAETVCLFALYGLAILSMGGSTAIDAEVNNPPIAKAVPAENTGEDSLPLPIKNPAFFQKIH